MTALTRRLSWKGGGGGEKRKKRREGGKWNALLFSLWPLGVPLYHFSSSSSSKFFGVEKPILGENQGSRGFSSSPPFSLLEHSATRISPPPHFFLNYTQPQPPLQLSVRCEISTPGPIQRRGFIWRAIFFPLSLPFKSSSISRISSTGLSDCKRKAVALDPLLALCLMVGFKWRWRRRRWPGGLRTAAEDYDNDRMGLPQPAAAFSSFRCLGKSQGGEAKTRIDAHLGSSSGRRGMI